MTIDIANNFILQWTLTDGANPSLPVDNATVVATLYIGRSKLNPLGVPGMILLDAVTNQPVIDNAALIGIGGGVYQAQVPAFQAEPGGDYVLVVDGDVSNAPVYHKEEPIVLVNNQ